MLEEIKNRMKSELAESMWLYMGDMTNIKEDSILNVILRPLELFDSSSSVLPASKKV